MERELFLLGGDLQLPTEASLNAMCYINSRFSYLLTYTAEVVQVMALRAWVRTNH